MNKASVREITTKLGAAAICDALDVTPHSVRHARTTGVLPASWYDVIFAMCAENGIACPRDAFNWKAVAKKDGNPFEAFQGDAA